MDLLKALNNGENVRTGDVQSYILNNFTESIEGQDVSVVGMAAKVQTFNENIQTEHADISSRWNSQLSGETKTLEEFVIDSSTSTELITDNNPLRAPDQEFEER